MELLQLLTSSQQQQLLGFVETFRHVTDTVTEISHMKWVAAVMELVANTPLANVQKKALVTALYQNLAQDEHNAFKAEFDVESAIEFVWDASRNRFGVVVRPRGRLAQCLPCCADVSVTVEPGRVTVGGAPPMLKRFTGRTLPSPPPSTPQHATAPPVV